MNLNTQLNFITCVMSLAGIYEGEPKSKENLFMSSTTIRDKCILFHNMITSLLNAWWVVVSQAFRSHLQRKFLPVIDATYVGHLESKERLRIQPAQLFNFS